MNKAYLLKRTRRLTLVYMAVLIAMSIYILVKLVGLYFSNEIISFKNLIYSDLDSSFFTRIVGSINPSFEYYLESNKTSKLDIRDYNQIESLYGYHIPLISFVMNNSDYSYYTTYENYPKINSQGQIIENVDELYIHDESVFASPTLERKAEPIKPINYTMEQLNDFSFLLSNFYQLDSSIPAGKVTKNRFPIDEFLSADMSINKSKSGPKILIYHTHSQESFVDSAKGRKEDTIVGVGDELARILEEEYNIQVIHHRKEYDIIDGKLDRDKAYELIEAPLKNIIEENPSIEILIDLHRDGVKDKNLKFVKEVNGKPTAKIMFFNGLAIYDKIMPNKYVTDNMAFSFQMHLKTNELYPGLTRKIYMRPYRFNMHLKPKTLLIELGAQTNTVQEAKNAMEPLAKILYEVIK